MLRHFSDNPVVFKETREPIRGRGIKFLTLLNTIIYPIIFVTPFCAVSIITLSREGFHGIFENLQDILRACFYFSTGAQFFYILISSVNNTQFSFTREKEQRTYDGLVSTLMKPAEILSGKLISGMYPVAYSLILYSPLFFVLGLFSGLSMMGLVIVFSFSLLFSWFCSVVGLFASAYSSSSGRAQSVSTAIIGSLIAGTFIVDVFINLMIQACDHHFNDPLPIATMFNPGLGYISAACCYCNPFSEWFSYFWILQAMILIVLTKTLWSLTVKRIGEIPRS